MMDIEQEWVKVARVIGKVLGDAWEAIEDGDLAKAHINFLMMGEACMQVANSIYMIKVDDEFAGITKRPVDDDEE